MRSSHTLQGVKSADLNVSSLLFFHPESVNECLSDLITETFVVLKFTLVVDNDTTLHDVHTDTVAFHLPVVIKCMICFYPQSLTRIPPRWLQRTIHGIRHKVISIYHISFFIFLFFFFSFSF